MADPVDELPKRRHGGGKVHNAKYPWHEWFDGQVWKLKHGEDFNTTPLNFQSFLHYTAKRKGLRVKTRTMHGYLFLQCEREP